MLGMIILLPIRDHIRNLCFTGCCLCWSFYVCYHHRQCGFIVIQPWFHRGNSCYTMHNCLQQAFREKIESVSTYMRYKGIPAELQDRVLDYYEYLWSRQKGWLELSLLILQGWMKQNSLLICLHQWKLILLFSSTKKLLRKSPFLKMHRRTLLMSWCANWSPRSVLQVFLDSDCVQLIEGEYIIRFGDIGREMYFINRGVVVVCSEDGKSIYNVLTDGSFFGEYALLFSQKRTGTRPL